MTQPDELRYFFWCCAKLRRPGRRVVELGPWLGASTTALAAGLRLSDPRGRVVTIDRFRWDDWALEHKSAEALAALTERQRDALPPAERTPTLDGEFISLFRAFTAPFANSIDAREADLEHFRWRGGRIDVLMVDAAKSWAAYDRIVSQFFPKLVEGAAVIQQDYKFPYCYWLHIVSERMIERGVLSIAENIHYLTTQGFRFHRTHRFHVRDYLQHGFTFDEQERLMLRSIRRFRAPYERLAVIGCYVCLLKKNGRYEEARRVFTDAIEGGGFSENYGLEVMVAQNVDWARPLAHRLPARLIPKAA